MTPVHIYRITFSDGTVSYRVTRQHHQSLRHALRRRDGKVKVFKVPQDEKKQLPKEVLEEYRHAVDMAC